jgi:hypothetical protein
VTPPIAFPDGQRAVRDLLVYILGQLTAPVTAGATVGIRDIPGADEGRPIPYVQVRLESSTRDTRLNGRADVRVLVYHGDEGLCHDLASLLYAHLLSATSSDVRAINPGDGPGLDEDPDNGLPFAYFTITARLRPRSV